MEGPLVMTHPDITLHSILLETCRLLLRRLRVRLGLYPIHGARAMNGVYERTEE